MQRIAEARIVADRESKPVGEVKTACQAACPAQVFTFGNLADPNSEVAKRKRSPLDFAMLEAQATRPRTTYEALVRNPNPAHQGASARERFSGARRLGPSLGKAPSDLRAAIGRARTTRWCLRASPPAAMTDRICAIALREKAYLWWWIAFVPSMALTLLLLVAIGYLFYAGIGIWGVSWPVMWGFAILSYVWWIAIASGGTIISALFFLVRADWRDSINRIAESMMLFGAAAAGIYPILHLGRPWLFYWLFFYPNTMTLWAQFRSPLLWDFWALMTYVLASVLFWYFGLIPDLASVRDRATTPVKQRIYGVLACGFRGTSRQWQHMRAAYGVMAAIMAPVVVSIHSIVGLDFAGAATPGWHSTEFPPFFVCGALAIRLCHRVAARHSFAAAVAP